MIAGSYKRNKPINITGIDEIHLKRDCIHGSIVNGVREPILYSFTLDKPPGHKTHHTAKIKLFKMINKSVLSHIRNYLKDYDHKAVDFDKQTMSFAFQLIKNH